VCRRVLHDLREIRDDKAHDATCVD
jgi:hypothetical protein